jgi:hypothetical protein
VHINRTPVAGIVTDVKYIPGAFLPAYRHDAHQNERSEIWIDHNGTPIVFRQVVGLLARRVVCRVKAGERLAAGARIGLMKFGVAHGCVRSRERAASCPHRRHRAFGCHRDRRPQAAASVMANLFDRLPGRDPRRRPRGVFLLPSLFTVGNCSADTPASCIQ